jgi:hypothetical protein
MNNHLDKQRDLCSIGSKVMWRGSWGEDLPTTAKVEYLILTDGYSKEGSEYNSLSWELFNERKVIVGLTNGHWAYGYQISKL